MQQDSDKLKRKHGIKAPALATPQDVEKVLDRCIEVCYNCPRIADDVSFTYYPAGHIILLPKFMIRDYKTSRLHR